MCPSRRNWASRRGVLSAFAAGAAVSYAGCVGGPTGESAEPTNEEDDELELLDHPVDEPRAFPEGYVCDAVCAMEVADYPEWNAQLAHEDETGAFFCTSGCMVTYRLDPSEFDGSDSPIAGVWVTDFETGELVDGAEAYYVLEDDVDRMNEPMGLNPRPFADRADASAYVEAHSLSEGDVVRLDAFDLDTVAIYRPNRLPDAD